MAAGVPLLLVALAVQHPGLDRVQEQLDRADTAAAVRVLGEIVAPDAPPDARAVGALLLLRWLARAPGASDAARHWERGVALARRLRPRGAGEVLVAAADGIPAPPPASLARLATTGDDPHAAAAAYVLAQDAVTRLHARLPELLPLVDRPPGCQRRPAPCVRREPFDAPPGWLARLVAGDSLAAVFLADARRHFAVARAAEWPISELAWRQLTGVEITLGAGPALDGLHAALAAAVLPARVRWELAAVLGEFAGDRLGADSVFQADPARAATLDAPAPYFDPGPLDAHQFWLAAWPFYLQPVNTRQIAHRARVLAADLLGRMVPGDAVFGLVGGRRDVVLRGLPRQLGRAGPEVDAPIVERAGPAIHETVLPLGTGLRAPAALDLALAARAPESARAPSGFVAGEYDGMQHFEHQAVRVERDGRPWLHFYAERPALCAAAQPVLGMFLLDAFLRVVRHTVDSTAGRTRRYRVRLPVDPGTVLYSLELIDPGCRWAARARYILSVEAPTGFGLSDPVLAERLRFDGAVRVTPDREPVAPRYGLAVRAGDPVHLYWEVYGMPATGNARLDVRVTVVDLEQRPVPVRQLGRVASAARSRDAALDTRYAVRAPDGTGPVGLGVSLALPETADGVFMVRVSVTRTDDGRTATRSRALRVVAGR